MCISLRQVCRYLDESGHKGLKMSVKDSSDRAAQQLDIYCGHASASVSVHIGIGPV